jgi:hypothetical protein
VDFAEAYLVAHAEVSGVSEIVSFDRSIDQSRASGDASHRRPLRHSSDQKQKPTAHDPSATSRCGPLPGSDRPGALRRRALLRTGLATFTASGSSNLRRVGQSQGLRSVHQSGRVVRRSTHPGRWPRRLVCPLVRVSSLSSVGGGHLTTSARFRARAPGPVSGRLSTTTSWRGWSRSRDFPLRFRRPRSLLGHPVPAKELGLPHGRLTGQRPDPDGVSAF